MRDAPERRDDSTDERDAVAHRPRPDLHGGDELRVDRHLVARRPCQGGGGAQMLRRRLAEHPRHHLLGGGGSSRGIDYISHPVGARLPRDGRGAGRRLARRPRPLRRADPAGGLRRRLAGHGAAAGLSLLTDPGLSRLQSLSRVETLLEAGTAFHPVHRRRFPGDPPGGCRPAIRPHDERRSGLSLRRPGLRQYPSHPRLKPHRDGDGRAAPPAGGQIGSRHLWPANERGKWQQRQPAGR